MLKALELTGFKSFADKTRFAFPPGITVIVGPNGSGKSNIVDAIKWVLGEQSAKSLRGKDMADVIFKSSATSNRRAINTAEATIIFENEDRRLPVDAPEVHVTRRVFRSGEGEYLINRQPCRLKDVKDLFRGTGVGTDAYSLIEQGKVDRLLQATARDRRAIFEEAAGISRFKAKKIEAQRRLERVEQNLLRLSDIVDEVESRLRSVRNQAGKARRYREYSDRLQQLRTEVGLADWRTFSEKLSASEGSLLRIRDETGEAGAQIELLEARELELETEIDHISHTMREIETQAGKNREQIASWQSKIHQQRERCVDLEKEETRFRRQLTALTTRAGDMHLRVDETKAKLATAKSEQTRIEKQLAQHEQLLEQSDHKLRQLREQSDARQDEFVQQSNLSAALDGQVKNLQSQATANEESSQQNKTKLAQLEAQVSEVLAKADRCRQQHQQHDASLQAVTAELEDAEDRLHESRNLMTTRREELAIQQGRVSGIRDRIELLKDLDRKLEGLGPGVAQLLQDVRAQKEHANGEVVGLVADIVQADFDDAPLIDAALGERAQLVVVRSDRIINELVAQRFSLESQVGFALLSRPTQTGRAAQAEFDLTDEAGVIARADRIVKTSDEFLPLVQRLLGTTWFVNNLPQAIALAAKYAELRFVTSAGEVVEPDGTIIVGPRRSTSGLVSRRSELRELTRQSESWDQQISDFEAEIHRLSEDVLAHDREVRQLRQQRQTLSTENAELRISAEAAAARSEQLAQQQAQLNNEVALSESQHADLLADLKAAIDQAQTLAAAIETIKSVIQDNEQAFEQQTEQHEQQLAAITAVRVDLARAEQQVDVLQLQLEQFEQDKQERKQGLLQIKQQVAHAQQRRREYELDVLSASSAVAAAYLANDQFTNQLVGQGDRRATCTADRTALSGQLQSLRKQMRASQDRQHQVELAASELRLQRDSLAERIREDYGIELSDHAAQQLDDQAMRQREAVETEIAELRRKINNIGAVNMEALNELDDLDTRFSSLSSQFADLTQAKESLERIIHRINADSRRVFVETLDGIRENFRVLYRKAFGGGTADIVLEPDVDVLEAGVEIIATPPGKPSFNNSLLSGGEKALTAVALLLAIFQFRPSPFCVLDEVDAPFDEANIGRFIDVLREFLDWTKFVIVTHSKKTMTAATTLYGVTMQESGISKQVSVRFEDVSEDGRISQAAIEREPLDDDETDERGAA